MSDSTMLSACRAQRKALKEKMRRVVKKLGRAESYPESRRCELTIMKIEEKIYELEDNIMVYRKYQ